MNKAEEAFIERFGKLDKHEKKFKQYDYWDMIDFAEQYAQQVSRNTSINFARYMKTEVLRLDDLPDLKRWYEMYDTWIKNQQ